MDSIALRENQCGEILSGVVYGVSEVLRVY